RFGLSLRLEAGQIVCISGPSGAGKSLLLDALYAQSPPDERIRVESIALERDRSVIDCVNGPLSRSLELLSRAGLSDVPCLLRPPAMLSNGQQWRYRLARAWMSGRQLIFADEFCASLDATTALVTAYQARRIANTSGRIFVLAGCREDVLVELRPDVLVVLGGREADVIYQNSGRNSSRS
ncbi:MAG TPA: ATP-binding cassette domain-containing protein, partial [Phycisphaerales bacterium]|nr:ATP-binding cassette domain-containing protein [Phycisphaerales bacterium]